MARMTDASWRPIPVNYTANGQAEVRGVVVHIMAGTLAGTDSWFRNPQARASSHFGTGKAGALYQWVDTKDRAWAQAGGNTSWISVENEGQGGDVLTDEQLDANAEVLAWAYRVYSVPLQVASGPNGKGLGWHAMGGSAWGGHTSCPGPKIVAQLPEIVRRAKSIINEEDDVSLTDAQAKQLKAVYDLVVPYAGWDYKGKNEKQDAYAYLRNTSADVKALAKAVAAQQKTIDALTAAVKRLSEQK